MTSPVARRDPTPDESSMLSVAPGLITSSGVPTDEQFMSIRERFGDPRAANVRPDDYYVFRMIASGDGLDSYFTKQDLETSFPNFVRDLKKGQSVLGSHQMATFSYGSSYDAEITPAEEDRAEYEATFYPQWDSPELRTKNWLVGDYFIGRGVEVNNQSTDSLIRAIELGNIRKASISFMVGSYQCGIDGKDLIPTMFGPMPDEECNHFPGIAYEGQIAWALMKHNTLVETSLVYKNASPSSMLLRKAESLAADGKLNARQIDTLEARFQVRLPRFQRTVWSTSSTANTNGNAPVSLWVSPSGQLVTTSNVRFDAQVQEESNMANRPQSGDAATRDIVREALTAEEEPEQDETEVSSEAPEGAEAAEPVTADGSAHPDGDGEGDGAAEGELVDPADVPEGEPIPGSELEEEAEDPDASAESDAEDPDAEEPADASEGSASDDSVDRSADGSGGQPNETEGEASPEAAAPDAEEGAPDTDSENESESTREEDAVSTFVAAADRLASVIARSPDAFDSGLLAMAARAEKAVDLALIDAGCDATVGSQVARSFEIRNRKLNEALGQPMTVETIRSLQEKAKLGDELFAELVRDAVAARIGAQGDAAFNAQRYSDVLTSTRDVAYVKDEIASWQSQKAAKYTPGRSVVPRQPVDAKPTAAERKALPEARALTTGKRSSDEATTSSLIKPRSK